MPTASEQKSTPASAKKQAGTPAKAGGKKGQRKDDEWEEVSRKYVRLPLNDISIFLFQFLFCKLPEF